jgi:hypothetical protein
MKMPKTGMLKLIPRHVTTVVRGGDDTVVVGGGETNDPKMKPYTITITITSAHPVLSTDIPERDHLADARTWDKRGECDDAIRRRVREDGA